MPLPSSARSDLQLAYLILLTARGLKPLSRWERTLGHEETKLVHDFGLDCVPVGRRTRLGKRIQESVFALRPRYTTLYRRRFDGQRLREKPYDIRLQGRLFGYPSCCVESFIRKPYAPNGLAAEDQAILFHWACPACASTQGLLREYRRVYHECLQLFGRPTAELPRKPRRGSRLPESLTKVAATLALIAGTAGIAYGADDPHWLPTSDDLDADFLSVAEEILRGTDWEHPDTDRNLVLDGIQTGHLVYTLVMFPPPGVVIDAHPARGLENCTVCGEPVNMGYLTVSHSQRGLAADIPYMALHYLHRGSLSFSGTLNSGRVNLDAVKRILFPADAPHLLAVPGEDPDLDGLLSEEEPGLGTDPLDPDSDDDSLIDGPQVAENLLARIAALPRQVMPRNPYLLEYWADGMEQCEVCGETLNMGLVEIVNPLEEMSVLVPFMGLHTLAHGGFVYEGTTHEGHVLALALQTVLTSDGSAHWVFITEDTDRDGLKNAEEQALDMNPSNPDEDYNLIPDGHELAMAMAREIAALPEEPVADRPYVLQHPMFGSYMCLTCGEMVNMGSLEIINETAVLTFEVPYYSLHFLAHGSFSTDREDLYARVDPHGLYDVLGMSTVSGLEGWAGPDAFVLRNSPNPFVAGHGTIITLSLPSVREIEVVLYDIRGRKVREIYTGHAPGRVARFHWDGRNDDGQALGQGIYFCKVQMGQVSVTRKLTLTD